MARVKDYFTHDVGARNDDKLLNVRMKFGAEGYGIYFMLIERLREDKDYTSVKDYNAIAFDLRVDTSKVKSIVEDFGLFVFTEDGEYFYSESLNDRMDYMESKSEQRSEAAKKAAAARWNKEKDKSNADAMRSHNESNASAMQPECDVMPKIRYDKIPKDKIPEDRIDDRAKYAQKLDQLLGESSSTTNFLEKFKPEEWPILIREVEKSSWLKENLNRSKSPSKSFMSKVLAGQYRDYTSGETEKRTEKSTQSRADGYTADELEAMARRKWQSAKKEV